jgi:hypothetical protein
VQSSGDGILTYTTSRTIYSADELKTVRFRWRTTGPGATGGLVIVANGPDFNWNGGLVGYKFVALHPNATYSTFDLGQLRTFKKFANFPKPHGKYYIAIRATNESSDPHGKEFSKPVMIEYKAPRFYPTQNFKQKIGPVGKFPPQATVACKFYKTR